MEEETKSLVIGWLFGVIPFALCVILIKLC
jgi:hypothetical protein